MNRDIELGELKKEEDVAKSPQGHSGRSGNAIFPFSVCANSRLIHEISVQQSAYKRRIEELERVLQEHGIEVPQNEIFQHITSLPSDRRFVGLIADGSVKTLTEVMQKVVKYRQGTEMNLQFKNLTYWTMQSPSSIPTVGTAMTSLFCGGAPAQRRDVLKDLTGRIVPNCLTLVLGPPSSGKTTFLKALAGRLKSEYLEGAVTINGHASTSPDFLMCKVADYIDQGDEHSATLTVEETLSFAWKSTTGGHHGYMHARDETSAEIMNADDKIEALVNNVMTVLGLTGCKNTIVGDTNVRGISGGQKRRVSTGEYLVCPRQIKCMDSITNGLDTATAFDIMQSLKVASHYLKITLILALMQPTPEVFNLFDELILLSEGQIIYHGAASAAVSYFASLGYTIPPHKDAADYLQEIPTDIGASYASADAPVGTEALVSAWKASSQFASMSREMDEIEQKYDAEPFKWPAVYNERFPRGFWYHFQLVLHRQWTLFRRDKLFIRSRIMQSIVIGAIAGSLFNNIEKKDVQTMNGFLFFGTLFCALANMAMLPIVIQQRNIFYKHKESAFYSTIMYVISQTCVMYPLMILEVVIFCCITYYSVGLSLDEGRFGTFLAIIFMFSLTASQLYRCIGSFMPTVTTAQPMSGVITVLMVLFSGYIIPKDSIPEGWKWFYWINPLSWAINSVSINEFASPKYDFQVCADVTCSSTVSFSKFALEFRDYNSDERWIWYGFAVLLAEYFALLVLTVFFLKYIRADTRTHSPPPVAMSSDKHEKEDTLQSVDMPFDQVTFAFRKICYTVTLPSGEDLELLRNVSGHCKPGTITALMGSSGAGKTTLLDVLSFRKNTGSIKGNIYVNGKEVKENEFRRMMAYVEQMDTLYPHDTVLEAVEFSANLRLPQNMTSEMRTNWIHNVLDMLELLPLKNELIGLSGSGLSFEQRKRVSIAVELVANPSILFLDEPTTGLDSRSAQVVVRCIRRVAESGRCVICTIHQPSTSTFMSFDALLLLQRGGQTVYFGSLANECEDLINYFQAIPDVRPISKEQNPATWMLEVIGAGTSSHAKVDFGGYYVNSSLHEANTMELDILCSDLLDALEENISSPACNYTASMSMQLHCLVKRAIISYWRSPTYNFGRMIISTIIALIFASAFANQHYDSDIDCISRGSVIYITCLFCGIVGMLTVMPVMFAVREAFYREQQSMMYCAYFYEVATLVVELPYLALSSLLFTLPFFFIVGFDEPGNTTEKFFWYWCFQCLYMSVLVFIGQFLVSVLPTESAGGVVSGVISTILSLFCGFMIRMQDFPTFWLFLYWLNPLHYALEGLFSTQFHNDDTKIVTLSGMPSTAEKFMASYYEDWKYENRFWDLIALLLFIAALRIGTLLSYTYLRHQKR